MKRSHVLRPQSSVIGRFFFVVATAAASLCTASAARAADDPPQFPLDFRSIDGWGNNAQHPSWGGAQTPFKRKMTVWYADGSNEPAGGHRKGARRISNLVIAQPEPILNPQGVSDFFWQWGQFLDHDLDETPTVLPPEPFDIPVPKGDPWFDPFGTGTVVIPFNRSFYEMVEKTRQQMNFITAYIDASNVYGSDEARANELRGRRGRLKTSRRDLLPFNVNGFPNAPTPNDPSFFLAGDVRANEQVALIAMHTLFVREHNHWARTLRGMMPHADDEMIYQCARAIVAAELQAITYNEFLPILLGPNAPGPYEGYDPDADGSIANEFAAAAFRFGHSMLSPQLLRLKRNGRPIRAGHLSLAHAFFNPQEVIDHGIEPLLRGLATQRAQRMDAYVIDEVRNFLFGPPGSGGLDLPALNIQRGRDHGLPSYNQARSDMGLTPADEFSDISSDPEIQARLASAYEEVDDIDLWVGGVAEDPVPGAILGETFSLILKDQFERIRAGDRFWYERYLPEQMVEMINDTRLSDIVRRNTTIRGEIADDVFRVEE